MYYTAHLKKKFDLNYGKRHGFNFAALKDIFVVVLILCDLKTYTQAAGDFSVFVHGEFLFQCNLHTSGF